MPVKNRPRISDSAYDRLFRRLQDPADIYMLKVGDFETLDGFAHKSANMLPPLHL